MPIEQVLAWLQGDEPSVWLNTPYGPAVTPDNRGLLYADGVFTTFRLHLGEVFLYDYHLARLQHAVHSLGLPTSCLSVIADVFAQLKLLLHHVSVGAKLVLVRAELPHARGYAPAPDAAVHIYIQLFKLPLVSPSIEIVGLLKGALGRTSNKLAGVKTLARSEQVLFAADYRGQGWSEGLVCDHNGHVIEAVANNVFIFADEQWVTPSLASGYGIHGVMRQYLLDVFAQQQLGVLVQDCAPSLLESAQLVLLTNALYGYRPVKELILPGGKVKSLCHDLTKHTSLPQLPWL